MQTSTIKFSQIEDRIDAEYYKPEYLILNSKLKNQKSKFLREFIKIKNGYPFDSTLFSLGNFPAVRIRDFGEDGVRYDVIETLPSYYVKKSGCAFPKLGDILVGMDGLNEFRAALITYEKDTQIAVNQRIAIISSIGKFSSEFLYIFLNSKVGQNQLLREMTTAGTVGHISNEIIKSLRISIPPQSFQQKIEKVVKEAQEKRKLADEKYKEAEEILNKELGLENLDLSTQKTFEAKFSEAEDRLDSNYFQPRHKIILEHLMRAKFVMVKSIALFNQRGVQPEYISHESKFKALTSKCIGKKFIDYDSMQNISEDFYNLSKEAELKKGDMVIYTTGAYVGNTQAITENIKAIASNHVNILRIKDFDPVFLAFYFNSLAGESQIRRAVSGAAQAELYPRDIEKIIIPIFSKSIQQKISSLIHESFKLRKEAKQLIEKAKREVEEIVERS